MFVDGREWGGKEGRFARPFDFYGVRGILVRRRGYQTRRLEWSVEPPWYSWFPIDFVSEFLVPWTITDQRELAVTLQPTTPLSARETDALIERAEAFAKESGSDFR